MNILAWAKQVLSIIYNSINAVRQQMASHDYVNSIVSQVMVLNQWFIGKQWSTVAKM